MLDLSSKFNWRGPQTRFNFDLTMNYADFQFQNVNDVTFDQYQFQQDVSAFMNNINALVAGVIGDDLEPRVAALESWKATGAVACGTPDIAVMEDWYYDPTEDPNNILKQRFRIRIQDGLITLFKGSNNTNVASNGVSCTTNDTLDGLEPVNNCA